MNATPQKPGTVSVRPPQLIQSLVGGFNAVSNHIYLVLLPIALDLLLWFGPHVRMKALLEPMIVDFVRFARRNSAMENRVLWDGMENLWSDFLNQFNLTSLLSTFPVGVPTLMGAQSPMETPVGKPSFLEATSLFQILLGWMLLSLIGLGLGTLYFALIARCCGNLGKEIDCENLLIDQKSGKRVPDFRARILAWQGAQVILMMLVLFVIAMLLMIPAVMMTSFLFLISPLLAQFVLLLISLSAVWFLIPLIFSPHGIFLCGQNVFNAMLSSTRVVRFALPGTGLFLLIAIVLYQGLAILWRVPPSDSWLALVGILGHAFISTGLLAASFIYYRGGLAYVQALRRLSFRSA